MRERIVITGLGVISPFGDGVEPFWDALKAGKNGITKVSLFDASELNCQIAAECRDFDAATYIDVKEARRSDRYTHLAVAAAKLAMKDAGLVVGENLQSERFGVLIGSGVGGMDTIEKQSRAFIERGPRRVSPTAGPCACSTRRSRTQSPAPAISRATAPVFARTAGSIPMPRCG